MDERLILLHLSLVDGFGPAALSKVLNFLKFQDKTLEAIYLMNECDHEAAGLSSDLSKKVTQTLGDQRLLSLELDLMYKYNIRFISILDDEYPELLKNSHLPPFILYVKGGNLLSFTKTLAVVGSRKCDSYGIKAIDLLLPDVIKAGWTLVSGGAYGIDTLAHKKALELKGKTIVVLGSGILNPYPSVNKNMFDKIAEDNGAIVSIFPLKFAPLTGNFPARNRVISGMSKACLVVQAAKKSGALITANFALDQGKEVGAVPGAIDNVLSEGCNELIRQGAACLTSSSQILEFLNDNSYLNSTSSNHTLKSNTESVEHKILSLCKSGISFDELLIKLDLSFAELNDKLLDMQLNGMIEQNFSGLWHASGNCF